MPTPQRTPLIEEFPKKTSYEWNTPTLAPMYQQNQGDLILIHLPADWILWGCCYPNRMLSSAMSYCPVHRVNCLGLNRSVDQSLTCKHGEQPMSKNRVFPNWTPFSQEDSICRYSPSLKSQSTGFFSECHGEGFCCLVPQVQRFTKRIIRFSCSHHQKCITNQLLASSFLIFEHVLDP